MSVENIKVKQKQGRLLEYKFSEELNPRNKLYRLRNEIDWVGLEDWLIEKTKQHRLGRDRRSYRLLLGLLMLQSMNNFSDRLSVEELEENVYWQYFCGYEYMEKGVAISESTLLRFRNIVGEDGLNKILEELTRVGIKSGAIKKKDLSTVIVDTTVQQKNIRHPHEAHLLSKAREEIVRLSHLLGIKLNETYAKKYKYSIIKLWRYKGDSKSKSRKRLMKKLKTILGRLIRICERWIACNSIKLSPIEADILRKAQAVHAQSCLSHAERKEYKERNKILYSWHAQEVECIGKGKLHKPFEFGNKVGLAVTGKRNFIVGVKSFHGNPYDGHTLKQTIDAVVKNTGLEIKKLFVDLGYRGNNFAAKSKVYMPRTKKKLTLQDKVMMKRRSAIEPVIGHLKHFGRMGRNYLKGIKGDIINPLISAIGMNLRNIARHILSKSLPAP